VSGRLIPDCLSCSGKLVYPLSFSPYTLARFAVSPYQSLMLKGGVPVSLKVLLSHALFSHNWKVLVFPLRFSEPAVFTELDSFPFLFCPLFDLFSSGVVPFRFLPFSLESWWFFPSFFAYNGLGGEFFLFFRCFPSYGRNIKRSLIF